MNGSRAPSAPELKAQIEAERVGRPFLVFRDGSDEQAIVTVEPGATELWVGRGDSADVRLGWDEEVSALHAQIEVVRDECTLVDDGLSRNGSYVNGERLRGSRRLRDRDVLRFGKTVAQFRTASADPRQTVSTNEALAAVELSAAQRRVLVALCRPFKDQPAFAAPPSNPEIAEELFLTVEAVKTHLRALFVKFAVDELPQNRKRLALVEQALQRGVIGDADL